MRRSSRCASFATVVLLAVSVGACAMFETGQTKLQAVKTVGIISAVGDQITVAKGGLTGLDTSRQSFPIRAWGPDDLALQQANAGFGGRLPAQPVTYHPAALATLQQESP